MIFVYYITISHTLYICIRNKINEPLTVSFVNESILVTRRLNINHCRFYKFTSILMFLIGRLVSTELRVLKFQVEEMFSKHLKILNQYARREDEEYLAISVSMDLCLWLKFWFSFKLCVFLKSFHTVRPITSLYFFFRKFFIYLCQLVDMNQTLTFCHKCTNICLNYNLFLKRKQSISTYSSKKWGIFIHKSMRLWAG
jgi:hypothetical protein